MTPGRRRLTLFILALLLVPMVLFASGRLVGRRPARRADGPPSACELNGKRYSEGAMVRHANGTLPSFSIRCRSPIRTGSCASAAWPSRRSGIP